MSHNARVDIPVLNLIPENLDGYNVLDVGIGDGIWGLYLRAYKTGKFTLTGRGLKWR